MKLFQAPNVVKNTEGGNICTAVNCHNRTYNSSVSLFKFPRQKERYI